MKSVITNRDLEIINIMKNVNKPMTVSDIVNYHPNLTKNTVQTEIRKLLKNNYVQVAGICYSGTVLCRNYILSEKAYNYMIYNISNDYDRWIKKLSASSFVSHLWSSETDSSKIEKDIKELEILISKYKKQKGKDKS